MQTGATPVTTYFVFLLIVLSTMAGCSFVQHDTSISVDVIKTSSAVNFHDSSAVKSRILQQFNEWRETPCKIGGAKQARDRLFRICLCYLPLKTWLQCSQNNRVAGQNREKSGSEQSTCRRPCVLSNQFILQPCGYLPW